MNAALLTRSVIDRILPGRLRAQPAPNSPDDRRVAPRRQAALSAEVVTGGRTYPGQIRNISTTGLELAFEKAPPLVKGAQLLVCAGTLAPFTGSVRWMAGPECGMAFNSALAEEIVEDTSALFDPGKRVRPGRARVQLTATVRGPGLDRKVTIENVCSGGAQLTTGLSLALNTGVMIEIDGILPIGGYVRWSHAGRCGVMFNKLLPITAGEEISRRCGVHASWMNELREAHASIVETP
ncbi:PilZ domain-containing protein [Sphingomonas sp. MA1305]|uniref:PilZ domain-containing protein n=1 Tax=Sphingomonas sp. MA1305 TaxID=2479204 RepID=UPI0018DF72A0|nr:PilZ domain-containing protein [Sphingomonas sp. MA1305]MBI0476689.1 PilZ domain-containing protein [Sphingomonas sp. MA1305]